MVDQELITRAKQRMEWAVSFMVVRYHFVYQLLALTIKACVPGLKTMGVRVLGSGKFELVYDPEFILNLKDEHLTYVMYHEVLHLALLHCTRRRFDNHELGNIAHDLAVNELIPVINGTCEAPIGELRGQHVEDYRKILGMEDIQDKQTAEWYYDYLKKKGFENKKSGFDSHEEWNEDPLATEKVRLVINDINKNAKWGNVGGVEREIILAAQTRRINWTQILHRFFGNLVWNVRESTRKRPNRRTGYVHPGSKNVMVDRHLVVADTSGSIQTELACKFLGVLNQVVDLVPLDFMQCDSAITEEPHPYDRRLKTLEFKGRGGTNFQPIIDLVDQRGYKSVIILTDGEAGACTKPKVAQVVWVLPEGCNPPVDWGKIVHMSMYTD